jgi:4-amino-4-deoxychorismate lyase
MQGLIPVTDRGLLYGDGLFETMLVRRGRIPLLPLHLDRLTGRNFRKN